MDPRSDAVDKREIYKNTRVLMKWYIDARTNSRISHPDRIRAATPGHSKIVAQDFQAASALNSSLMVLVLSAAVRVPDIFTFHLVDSVNSYLSTLRLRL